MIRRIALAFLLACLSLSLTNSVLLIGQLVAWSQMTQERTEDLGFGGALLSSIEGEDLCQVCLVIRDENRKQAESGTAKESYAIAKTLMLGNESSSIMPPEPLLCYGECVSSRTAVLSGRSEEVATPPPRFEV